MNEKKKAKTGLSRCLELASDKKILVILSAVLSSMSAICSFVPYLSVYAVVKMIIDVYPDMGMLETESVLQAAWIAIAGIGGNLILYFLAIVCSHLAAFGTIYELKLLFSKHLTKIPLGYHITIGSGKLRKIMEDNIESIEGFIAHQFPDFVASVTAPFVMLLILICVDWRFGLAALTGIVLAFVAEFIGYGSGEMKQNMEKYQTALEEMNNASVEFVRGMPVIKAFGRQDSSFERLKDAIHTYTEWVLKFSLGWQNCMPAFTTIVNNIYLILIPVGIMIGKNASDDRTFSMNFLFYLIFVPAIAGILNKIMYVSESFMEINSNVARMDEILYLPELPETDYAKVPEGFDVVFEDVSFSYSENANLALEHVSFTAKTGKMTAVIGMSGSGKSTIANLISRFWDVNEGGIYIGGVDIRSMSHASLMNLVSFVYQDTFLFKMSIADNIALGKSGASREEIMEAAKLAQCHEFIEKLPDGYDTVIGECGIHLSGGEKQRITIARAILKDAPVIVLDEATAFSDPENEYLIKRSFENLTKNKTVIMIAHRLGTIKDADEILVMDNGRLKEQGTHSKLLSNQGRYKKMWDSYSESIEWKVGGAC